MAAEYVAIPLGTVAGLVMGYAAIRYDQRRDQRRRDAAVRRAVSRHRKGR